MITVTRKVFVRLGVSGRKELADRPAPPPPAPPGRIPRISRLMALAIKLEAMIRDGTVRDQTELAYLARVTQPRMTQILNLNHLAPDIQETLLHLPPICVGRETIHERLLRPVCAEISWRTQRKLWSAMCGGRGLAEAKSVP